MAHAQQMSFVASIRHFLPGFFRERSVLEVGSLDVNGSVRTFFEGCRYVGIDLGPGKGVDVVARGEAYDAPDAAFDVVVSCEMMEHNPEWRRTWLNMIRMLRGDGLLLMTCAGEGRRRHGTPDSFAFASPLTVAEGSGYYRNLTERDFLEAFDPEIRFPAWAFLRDCSSHDLYFFGVGRQAPAEVLLAATKLKEALVAFYRLKNEFGLHHA